MKVAAINDCRRESARALRNPEPRSAIDVGKRLRIDSCGRSGCDSRGMLTDRDICMAAYPQDANLHNPQAVNAMATNVLVRRPDDALSTAQEIIREHRVRRLPVVNEDRHLGLESTTLRI